MLGNSVYYSVVLHCKYSNISRQSLRHSHSGNSIGEFGERFGEFGTFGEKKGSGSFAFREFGEKKKKCLDLPAAHSGNSGNSIGEFHRGIRGFGATYAEHLRSRRV
eukprot:1177966-Prorocentrum_minimum.AAC.3